MLTTMVKESALCEHTRPGESSSVQPPWLLDSSVRPCLNLTRFLWDARVRDHRHPGASPSKALREDCAQLETKPSSADLPAG